MALVRTIDIKLQIRIINYKVYFRKQIQPSACCLKKEKNEEEEKRITNSQLTKKNFTSKNNHTN